jgi:hypothetical protein
LLDEDESVPAHRKQAVSVIRRGGDHLLSLIEGTLDIARIEGGKLTLEMKPMRFQECVQQIVRMFELQAAGKGLAFAMSSRGSIPEVVRTDEKRMRQVLINVLGNAVKFTSAGQVVFRMSYAREMAVFEIEDTGPGIAAHEIEQIFEPFARGSAVSSTASGGTGLGLTISKMLTDLMGGEMSVQSKVATTGDASSGTLFRIRLFLPEVRAAVAERELPRLARIGYAGRRRSVLVVDNEGGRPRPARQRAGAAGLRRAACRVGPRMPGDAAGLHARRDPDGPGHARHRRLGDHPPHARRGPEHGARGHRLGQCLRQGTRQRRRHRAERLRAQAGAQGRAARLAGRALALEWLHAPRLAASPRRSHPPIDAVIVVPDETRCRRSTT